MRYLKWLAPAILGAALVAMWTTASAGPGVYASLGPGVYSSLGLGVPQKQALPVSMG